MFGCIEISCMIAHALVESVETLLKALKVPMLLTIMFCGRQCVLICETVPMDAGRTLVSFESLLMMRLVTARGAHGRRRARREQTRRP